jgi:predicted DNA-binding transcriptional regulator AlpA
MQQEQHMSFAHFPANQVDGATPLPNIPVVFLDQRQTASLLNLSERTLERFRLEGTGPAYCKFGRRVMYARADVLSWADARRRTSTSGQGAE